MEPRQSQRSLQPNFRLRLNHGRLSIAEIVAATHPRSVAAADRGVHPAPSPPAAVGGRRVSSFCILAGCGARTRLRSGRSDGPIAQLDRVADFYSAGCRFESCWDRQFRNQKAGLCGFFILAGPDAVDMAKNRTRPDGRNRRPRDGQESLRRISRDGNMAEHRPCA